MILALRILRDNTTKLLTDRNITLRAFSYLDARPEGAGHEGAWRSLTLDDLGAPIEVRISTHTSYSLAGRLMLMALPSSSRKV